MLADPLPAVRSAFLRDRILSSTNCRDLKRSLCKAAKTKVRDNLTFSCQ